MKILILGADGMIGHKLAQNLEKDFELTVTSRKKISKKDIGLNSSSTIINIDLYREDSNKLLDALKPGIVINCAGITIRRGVEKNLAETNYINSHLPHELDSWSQRNGKKLIHFSTDCVYDGLKGNYLDHEAPNATDIYGKSKAKGEINNSNSLTIRTSIIGREIYNHTELFEWLYSMRNKEVEGYTNALYSGVTNVWISQVINKLISNNINISGILNISSNPISKFDLISKLSNAFSLNIIVKTNSKFKSNKILISKKFTEITGIKTPDWDDLILEFKKDSLGYKNLYKN